VTRVDSSAGWNLVRRVSRTFYWSLRLLPKKMRGSAALGYLLARYSDTVADSGTLDADKRLQMLEKVGVAGKNPITEPWDGLSKPEAELVLALPSIWEIFQKSPDKDLIESVWHEILEGQKFDLKRFPNSPSTTLSEKELEQYTQWVAGSVGIFWTQLCERYNPEWTHRSLPEMQELGSNYGCGLQLLNIVKDAETDQARGRYYFPLQNRQSVFKKCHKLLGSGSSYAESIQDRRIRIASQLPVDLARASLPALENPERGRVTRLKVYGLVLHRILFA